MKYEDLNDFFNNPFVNPKSFNWQFEKEPIFDLTEHYKAIARLRAAKAEQTILRGMSNFDLAMTWAEILAEVGKLEEIEAKDRAEIVNYEILLENARKAAKKVQAEIARRWTTEGLNDALDALKFAFEAAKSKEPRKVREVFKLENHPDFKSIYAIRATNRSGEVMFNIRVNEATFHFIMANGSPCYCYGNYEAVNGTPVNDHIHLELRPVEVVTEW